MVAQFEVEVLLDGQLAQSVMVPRAGLSIGRSDTNDLVLTNRSVSKRHARLVPSGQQLVVTDLDSTAGTIVKGRKIGVATLAVGDTFSISPYVLRISAHQAAETGSAQPQETQSAPSTQPLRQAIASLSKITALVGITDMHTVLEALLEQTMLMVGADLGFVVLATDGGLSPVVVRHGQSKEADERFSRTVCQEVLESRAPVLLAGPHLKSDHEIQSFALLAPDLVLAVPLIDLEQVRGVLYLESEMPTASRVAPPALTASNALQSSWRWLAAVAGEEPHLFQKLLGDLAQLGGRALSAAVERNQLVGDRDRWQWLASQAGEEPDLFRSSESKAMVEVLEVVRRMAREDVTALILGESGTGKEVTAQTLHRLSRRAAGPFIPINCGAIPKDLIEAELFGYEKGAFTGAMARRPGRLEMAQGGTLLLDEIGDMPKDLQVKLLRALESRSFERLGGTERIRWDGRLLAATNRDLKEAVDAGEFRADLYYRLNVVSIRLPPLRERPEDIEGLVNEILLVANRRFQRKLFGVTRDALRILQSYSWPGNVRELRNIIERAFIVEKSDRITPDALPFGETIATPLPSARSSMRKLTEAELPSLEEFMERQEREYIQLVLEQTGGNVTHAARILKLARTAFHRKLRHIGLRGSTAPDDEEV